MKGRWTFRNLFFRSRLANEWRDSVVAKWTAIIFDMDGLMVDTEPLARRAWEVVLATYGATLADEIYGRMIGRRTAEAAQTLLDNVALPLTAVELAARKSEIFEALRAEGVPMMPGLVELQTAVLQRGLPWAVATSSPRRHAQATLVQLGMAAACHAIAAGDEVENGKPAPDIYLLAAQRLGIPPKQCVALEDSVPGCRAALAAGMQVVAVPNGQTETADFSFAHHVFASLHEVAQNLDLLLGGEKGITPGQPVQR